MKCSCYHLRSASSAFINWSSLSLCLFLSRQHSSSDTDILVLSLPSIQLAIRPPFSVLHSILNTQTTRHIVCAVLQVITKLQLFTEININVTVIKIIVDELKLILNIFLFFIPLLRVDSCYKVVIFRRHSSAS